MRISSKRALTTFVLGLACVSPAGAIEFRLLRDCSNPQPSPFIFYGIGEPKLSSDGRWLAMTQSTTYPPWYEWWPSITVAELTGSGGFEVIVPEHVGWHYGSAWSPDGRLFAVGADGVGDTRGIWILDVSAPYDPSSYRRVTSDTSPSGGIVWSPDGASLVFADFGQLYRVAVAGGTPTPLGVYGDQPSCGPDGQVVYVRGNDLWIVDGAGHERRLTETAAYEISPSWSPDGRWIVFASNRSGNWDAWLTAPTGGTAIQVTHDAVDQHSPTWSTDDDLVFMSTASEDRCSVWLATDLPDWTIGVEQVPWSTVKRLFR